MGRKDARYMKELDVFQRFYTHLMPSRVTASCWTQLTVNAQNLVKFIDTKKQADEKYTIFQIVMAALIRTASQYPQLNRFIYGHKIYSRNEYVFSFAVNLGEETVFRKVWLNPEDTLLDVRKKLDSIITNARSNPKDSLDNSVDFLMKLPGFITSFILKLYPWMVDKGIFPKKFVDEDILFSSAVVSNLGSFGIRAPYHHLYEWGNASVFITIGVMEKIPVVLEDDSIKALPAINFGFTVDERVCDGKVISNALNYFKNSIENPWSLEVPPEKVVRE